MVKKFVLIVPVMNEETAISEFVETVDSVIREVPMLELEYLFVDDGSMDKTVDEILRQADVSQNKVTYLSFSRNFGKEAAIYAGLTHANRNADYVGLIDVDLQDPPQLLSEMFSKIDEGADVAVAVRKSRDSEPFVRRMLSDLFYFLMNKISQTPIIPGVRDFRVMTREYVDAVLQISERSRFSKGIFSWVGYKQEYLSYDYQPRKNGKTSWSLWGLFKYAFEGIVDFSSAPLMIVSALGIMSFFLAALGALFIVVRAVVNPGAAVFGWPSLVVLILAVSGIQLFSLGVVGRYISSIFIEVKKRPVFLIKKRDTD
ncbi:glycosyltransferase family 2 protein [Weissella confusa]|uniref:glycosyltransferase family 2 protein n=1 Tax=Weissella confusa TaxID=1583 RepID=UPI0018F14601|nr:glycosyltransferase family 2 protein [Weissella confusa]MBJ7649513.1 glycosyltransferase family 2 protein [Weissella confusa]MBJ7662072.1 glycosyltransferase family 2 protein [Weissella confusa]